MTWYDEKAFKTSRYGLKVDNFVFQGKSEYQTIDIFDNKLFGRVLALDGIYQTSTEDEYYYHEMITHPILTICPEIREVLIIGGGDLGTVRRVLQYTEVKHVDLVEIDEHVITVCNKYMPTIGKNAQQDKRLIIHIEDGTNFVNRWLNKSYDVIIIDGSDPVGPAKALVSQEFYQNCYDRLTENGILVTQSGSSFSMKTSFYEIAIKLQNIFEDIYPYFAPVPLYTNGDWSYIMALKGVKTHPQYTNSARIKEIKSSCSYYNTDIHSKMFVLPENIKCFLFPHRV